MRNKIHKLDKKRMTLRVALLTSPHKLNAG